MKSGTAMAAISRRIVARNVRRPTGEFVDIRPFWRNEIIVVFCFYKGDSQGALWETEFARHILHERLCCKMDSARTNDATTRLVA
jgi:hypothetical protein